MNIFDFVRGKKSSKNTKPSFSEDLLQRQKEEYESQMLAQESSESHEIVSEKESFDSNVSSSESSSSSSSSSSPGSDIRTPTITPEPKLKPKKTPKPKTKKLQPKPSTRKPKIKPKTHRKLVQQRRITKNTGVKRIKQIQLNKGRILSKKPLLRALREFTRNDLGMHNIRFSKDFAESLIDMLEMLAVEQLKSAYNVSLLCGNVQIQDRHIKASQFITENNQPLKWSETETHEFDSFIKPNKFKGSRLWLSNTPSKQ